MQHIKEIINQYKQLLKMHPQREYALTEELEKKLEDYLTENPCDTEIWIQLAFFVYDLPLIDIQKTIDCLEKAISCDPNNSTAVLFLGYAKEYLSYLDDHFFEKLCNVITKSPAIASMIEYEKYFYHRYRKNYIKMEESLLKSIEYCDSYVWNNIRLARLYKEINNIPKYKEYFFKGFHNITHVYQPGDNVYDPYDINEFFNERLKGIHLSWVNHDIIRAEYEYAMKL